MRIRTDGEFEHRKDAIESAKQALDETTNTGAILGACEFTRKMRQNLKHAVDHPDMTPELAELLSTSEVPLEYRIESSVGKETK